MPALCKAFLLLLLLPFFTNAQKGQSPREYYQLTIFNYSDNNQEEALSNYLRDALVPALHRQHLQHVGVFSSMANDTSARKKIFLVIPFQNPLQWTELEAKLLNDKSYRHAAANYLAAANKPIFYNRFETIFMRSFATTPVMKIPAIKGNKTDHVYELRNYESATEEKYRNKLKMFNDGKEPALFDRLGFNAIFYGEVLAGSQMPNLMYLTAHPSMEVRNKKWEEFIKSPEWIALTAMTEYKDNLSRIESIFLKALPYSDF